LPIGVECACGHLFEARDDQAGGVVNCPSCGKAAPVPGLRDPLWTGVKVAAALGWALATAFAWERHGALAALACALLLGAVLWLLSRAL
jgi:hypothetical protein